MCDRVVSRSGMLRQQMISQSESKGERKMSNREHESRSARDIIGEADDQTVQKGNVVGENEASEPEANIEDVQDAVQEEMMRQGHFKVAESYILYRAHRTRVRDEEGIPAVPESQQESMIVVTEANGESTFWDGIDLKRRIDYATIGLDLNIASDVIEKELRRSL